MELAQIDTSRAISATDVGFRIAPRINAAGRMDIASDVVEMFLARDPAAARVLAEKLHRLNDERRATEAEALRAIEASIDALSALDGGLAGLLVLDDGEAAGSWHRGVIGILASRVVDRTGRPALVLTHEDGQAYGSGRSVRGFHLLDALTAVQGEHADPLLTRFGGHAHAVGFSLPSAGVSTLRARLEQYAAARQSGDAFAADLECDVEVRLSELTGDFLAAMEQLGPFGNGNAEPLFVSRAVRLTSTPRVVKERHLRMSVEDPEGGVRFPAMAWSRRTDWAAKAREEGWAENSRLDIAFRVRRNWHQDFGGWELEVLAVRTALSA